MKECWHHTDHSPRIQVDNSKLASNTNEPKLKLSWRMIMNLLDLVIAFLPGAVKLLQKDRLMEVGEGDIVRKSISRMSRLLGEVINWLCTI